MPKPFIIDAVQVKRKTSAITKFHRKGLASKRFRLDWEESRKLLELTRNHSEIYGEMRAFAKPPFPETYVELPVEDVNLDGTGEAAAFFGILRIGGRVSFYVVIPDRQHIGMLNSYVDVRPNGLFANMWPGTRGHMNDEEVASLFTISVRLTAITEVLWLLMHQPHSPIIRTDVAKGVSCGATAPRFWAAHSVLTIDLSRRKNPKELFYHGKKGGIREHEVRGTWVHYRLDRRCIHSWERVERPEGSPERWECAHCNAMRVWRRDHVRGNGKLGTKFHDYEVKL
jgi:hypothetical protein